MGIDFGAFSAPLPDHLGSPITLAFWRSNVDGMSRFVVRQGELDDMDRQQVLPVASTGAEEEGGGSNQPAMPGTAEEYLRMVRRQAHGIPDVVCRPLAPTQVLHRNALWYRGGLVAEAHRLVYHSA